MAKEELLEFPGVVKELLRHATFRVKLETPRLCGPASAVHHCAMLRAAPREDAE
jgi:hypothetical protein